MKYTGNIHVAGSIFANDIKVRKSEVSSQLISPWSKLNEGSSSGLDGDTIDNREISEFAKVNHTHPYLLSNHNEDENTHLDIQKLIVKDVDFIDVPKILNNTLDDFFGTIETTELINLNILYSGEHISTGWIIASDILFKNILFETTDYNNLTSFEMTPTLFKETTTYYIKTRYNSKHFCSLYLLSTLTTPSVINYIEKPSIKIVEQKVEICEEYNTFGDVGLYEGVEYKLIYTNGTTWGHIDDSPFDDQPEIEISEIISDAIKEVHIRYVSRRAKSYWSKFDFSYLHTQSSTKFSSRYNTSSSGYSYISGASVNSSFALWGYANYNSYRGYIRVMANNSGLFSTSSTYVGTSKIYAPSQTTYSYFGHKFASTQESNVTAVTAHRFRYNGLYNHGRIYIYKDYKSNNKIYFSFKTYIDIPFGTSDSYLGQSILELSDNGNSICFSLARSKDGMNRYHQTLVVARRSSSTNHDYGQLLHITDKVSSASFSRDGNTLYVGHDSDSNFRYGVVDVYKYINNTWVKEEKITPFIEIADYFGKGVSVSKKNGTDIIAIGNPGRGDKGLVRIYHNIEGVWGEVSKIYAPTEYTPDGDNTFGEFIQLTNEGNTLAIGVPNHVVNQRNVGAIIIYDCLEGVWTQTDFIIGNTNYDSELGQSFGISSDGKSIMTSEYRYHKILGR